MQWFYLSSHSVGNNFQILLPCCSFHSFLNHAVVSLCAKEDNHWWAKEGKSHVWNDCIASNFKQKIKVMRCWLKNWGMKRLLLKTWALFQVIKLIFSCHVMRFFKYNYYFKYILFNNNESQHYQCNQWR